MISNKKNKSQNRVTIRNKDQSLVSLLVF